MPVEGEHNATGAARMQVAQIRDELWPHLTGPTEEEEFAIASAITNALQAGIRIGLAEAAGYCREHGVDLVYPDIAGAFPPVPYTRSEWPGYD